MGFFELKSTNIPAVQWKRFTGETELDDGLLWTIRVATEDGSDLNLPRAVGARADEAVKKGLEFLDSFSEKGMVIYYPYFIAEKSGVLDINNTRTVIEAVDRDLWNLVTFGRKNVTAIIPCDISIKPHYTGDKDFLSQSETEELTRSAAVIRSKFRDEISEGRSVLAEWSFAYDTDIGCKPSGHKYLVFYELRCV